MDLATLKLRGADLSRQALSWLQTTRLTLLALDPLVLFFVIIGVIAVARTLRKILSFVWTYALRPSTSLTKYGAKQGAWAVVTGASDGIGKAFATKLAQSGFNVALVSRSKDKLTKVADEISKTSPSSQTLVIPCDAAIPKSPDVVVKALGDRDIRVLINNVGVSNAIPTELADMEEAEIARIIAVNATFNAQLSRLLIPTLKQEKASRHSAIVNVSSVAGIVSVPLQSVYSATKAFNDVFSRSLTAELRPYRIDVLSVTPAYVKTPMSGFRRTSTLVLSAPAFVNAALGKIGVDDTIVPNAVHSLYRTVSQVLPKQYLQDLIRNKMVVARKKLLRRRERAEKAA